MNTLHSIIIKPIGSFCNLNCKYCFYLDKQHLYAGSPSTHKMDEPTLDKLIQQLFKCSNHPTFVWQGGEPTVMGLDFFRHAVALQKHYAKGRTFFNALQTHAMLLNEDWADFLKRENFLVGVSLDGPQHVHDCYRLDRQGHGTFHAVFENAKMLVQQEVPVNVLATITDYSVQYPEEIYQFFTDNGFIFMQFSPVVEPDFQHPHQAAPFSVTAKQYGHFLTKVFKCWHQDFDYRYLKQKTSVRFFDSLMHRYVGMVPDHCALQQKCNVYLVVEHNGDLFSCDFLVSAETRLGNLHEISLQQAFNSPAHIAFGLRKANYGEECRRCQWLKLCYGGCIKDRLHDPRDHEHNHFCESYQYFFERVDSQFKELADLYRRYYR
ncbi:MAG: anaerobic sulfatase maturase [Thioploca sp.]|nr:anaerobic sulfatase maturase [Thioploca sp.]